LQKKKYFINLLSPHEGHPCNLPEKVLFLQREQLAHGIRIFLYFFFCGVISMLLVRDFFALTIKSAFSTLLQVQLLEQQHQKNQNHNKLVEAVNHQEVLYQQLSGHRKINEKPVTNGREGEEKEIVLSQHVHVVSHVWRNRQPQPDPRMPPSYSAVAGKGGVKEKEGAKDADKKEKEGDKDVDKKEKEGAKNADKKEKEAAKDADKNEKEGTKDVDKNEKEGTKDTDKNEEEEERWFRKVVFHLRSRVFSLNLLRWCICVVSERCKYMLVPW
jgi:hypothetical protein